ncbi:HNH endonuclease [Flavobacterium sp. FlaQc-57]|uniref:HNH endonuclease n=1 Tax=Flavobacterium sp. FlaQc-57 TaxID=3374186 RepID=UPI0037576D30
MPPITILVGDKNGISGTGFTAWDVDNIEEGFEKVYNCNWNNLENSCSYAITGTTEEEIVNELLNDPEKSKETYSKIKVRGTAQIIFRQALLKAYDSRCAFCDFSFSFSFALQAAHIIPWSKASISQRLDVRNGILSCANHHCLFDKGLLTIDNDYLINFKSNIKHKAISNYDNLLSYAFHNKTIKLPNDEKHWPNKEFLFEDRNANA